MKFLKRNIIIVDGPTGAGKSSLCWHLINDFKFNYYHIKRWHKELQNYYKDIIFRIIDDVSSTDSNYVIERFHLSDYVFSYINKTPMFTVDIYNFLQNYCLKNNINLTTILCLPDKFKNEKDDEIIINEFKKIKTSKFFKFYHFNYNIDSNYYNLDTNINKINE